MRNIIYSKYSNERADKFKIRTDIVEDFSAKKYVQKIALTKEGIEHINNIYMNYNLLCKTYKDSRIHICECNKIDEKLEFEYIEGKTFKEELDELVCSDDYAGVLEKIKLYIDIITSGKEHGAFKITEDFSKIFGEVSLPISLKCSNVSNIDLIFSNIIIKDKWSIIDYEWVFNFPIPYNYIIYRSIKIYINESSKRDKLMQLGLYKLLGITEYEIEVYNKMEDNFINYVINGIVPLYSIYNEVQKDNIDIRKMISERQEDKNCIQIFYNYGEGFSEENSYTIYSDRNKTGNDIIQMDIDCNVKEVRIDPGDNESIVYIERTLGYDNLCYNLDYHTNGLSLDDKTILFYHNDPQIIFPNIKNATNKIEIIFRIETISKDNAISICRFINNKKELSKQKLFEKNKLLEEAKQRLYEKDKLLDEKDKLLEENKQKLCQKNIEINKKNQLIKQYENELMEIKNSRGWKIVSNIHKIKDKL